MSEEQRVMEKWLVPNMFPNQPLTFEGAFKDWLAKSGNEGKTVEDFKNAFSNKEKKVEEILFDRREPGFSVMRSTKVPNASSQREQVSRAPFSSTIQRGANGVPRQLGPLTPLQRHTRFLSAQVNMRDVCGDVKPSQMADRRIDLTDEEQAVILKNTPHVLLDNENIVCFGNAYYIVSKDRGGEEHFVCRIWTKTNVQS